MQVLTYKWLMFYVTRFAASILFLCIKVHLFNHQCHLKPTYFQKPHVVHFCNLLKWYVNFTTTRPSIVMLNTRRLCSVVIWHKNEIQKIGIIIGLQNGQFIYCQFGNLAFSKSPTYLAILVMPLNVFQEYFIVFWRDPRLLASPLSNCVIVL